MGGLMSERSGVVQIGLEGFMLVGAFAAAALAALGVPPMVAFGLGGVSGALLASLYSWISVNLKGNQIVAGMGVNLLAIGLTPLLCKAFYGTSTSTPQLTFDQRLMDSPYVIVVLACAFVWVLVMVLRGGLWIRFAGEHPVALQAAGVSPKRVRLMSVMFGGFLAGMGGAVLSVCLASSFARNMTSGRGFIALVALILGRWRPIPTVLSCLLFGLLEVAQIRLQGVVLWGSEPVAVQFIQILPYVATLVVLSRFSGISHAPKALGLPLE